MTRILDAPLSLAPLPSQPTLSPWFDDECRTALLGGWFESFYFNLWTAQSSAAHSAFSALSQSSLRKYRLLQFITWSQSTLFFISVLKLVLKTKFSQSSQLDFRWFHFQFCRCSTWLSLRALKAISVYHKSRHATSGDRIFGVCATRMWNSVHLDLRASANLVIFCIRFKNTFRPSAFTLAVSRSWIPLCNTSVF